MTEHVESSQQSKRVLVTGGAGFVGSNLCRRLVREGYRVISLDYYFTGSTERHVVGVEYREGHTKDIERLVPEEVDLVFHLGEYSRVEKSLEDPPRLVWDLNVAGTFAVLEYCRKRRCKIVYAGSSTKFSDGGMGRHLTPYTWTKATNTELVRNYGTWYDLPFAIAYFYNVYGPGEISRGPYSTLIGIFSDEYRRGRPLTIVAPGTQRRNFTYIDDIINGLLLVGERGQGDEFGIGAAEDFSVAEVAAMFGGKTVMLPERRGNRMTSEVNSEKVKALGWEQTMTLPKFVGDFRRDTQCAPEVEKRILVFSTTFHPVAGPAENALLELMRRMPDTHFDIITTAFSNVAKDAPSPLANVTLHRLGYGKWFDKYLLWYFGVRRARLLASAKPYLFAWSLMASYATLTAALWKRRTETPLLISLADHDLSRVPWYLRFLLSLILKRADQVSASGAKQESLVARVVSSSSLSLSNRAGDVFANQIRFVYNSILNNLLVK